MITRLLFGVALCGSLVACGSSSPVNSVSSSTHGNPPGPSAEFMGKGGNNRPAMFGSPAGDAEREAASKVLGENLKARAGARWARQCSTLAATTIKQVEAEARSLGGQAKGCANAVKTMAEPLSGTRASRAYTLMGVIDVLRVKGTAAYALYHGTGQKDYAMPMRKEGGGWKVASLVTTEVP